MDDVIKVDNGNRLTYQFSNHGIDLYPSRPKYYLSCLNTCAREIPSCSGVEFNEETGTCVGFTTNAVLDKNGDFKMIPVEQPITSLYKGITLFIYSKIFHLR